MRKKSNSFLWPVIGICAAGMFCVLSSYSYGRYAPEHRRHGYTASQVREMGNFVSVQLAAVTAKPVELKPMSKAAAAARNRLVRPKTPDEWADVVADVWNLPEFKRGVQ